MTAFFCRKNDRLLEPLRAEFASLRADQRVVRAVLANVAHLSADIPPIHGIPEPAAVTVAEGLLTCAK